MLRPLLRSYKQVVPNGTYLALQGLNHLTAAHPAMPFTPNFAPRSAPSGAELLIENHNERGKQPRRGDLLSPDPDISWLLRSAPGSLNRGSTYRSSLAELATTCSAIIITEISKFLLSNSVGSGHQYALGLGSSLASSSIHLKRYRSSKSTAKAFNNFRYSSLKDCF